MNLALKVLLGMLLACVLGFAALVGWMRWTFHSEVTVEVVNQRSQTVPQLVAEFGGTTCGPQDVPPGKSVTCRFQGNAHFVHYSVGPDHVPQLWGDAYLSAPNRPRFASRVTLLADGGTYSECNRSCLHETLPTPDPQ